MKHVPKEINGSVFFFFSLNLRTLTRNDLVEYINSHYKAPRMVLATAGGTALKQLSSLSCSSVIIEKPQMAEVFA